MAAGDVRLDVIIAGNDQLSAVMKQASQSADEFAGRLKKATSDVGASKGGKGGGGLLDGLTSGLGKLGPAALGISAVAVGVTKLSAALIDAEKHAAIGAAFERDFASVEGAIGRLQAATAGLADDTSLQIAAQQAKDYGLSFEQTELISKAAAKTAAETGKDFASTFESLADAALTGSDQFIKLSGVQADVTKEAQKLASAQGLVWAELDQTAQRALRAEAATAALAKANKDGALTVDEANTANQRFAVAMSNLTDTTLALATTALAPVVDLAGDLAIAMTDFVAGPGMDFIGWAQDGAKELAAFWGEGQVASRNFGTLTEQMERQIASGENLYSATRIWGEQMGLSSAQAAQMATALGKVRSEAERKDIIAEYTATVRSYGETLEWINELEAEGAQRQKDRVKAQTDLRLNLNSTLQKLNAGFEDKPKKGGKATATDGAKKALDEQIAVANQELAYIRAANSKKSALEIHDLTREKEAQITKLQIQKDGLTGYRALLAERTDLLTASNERSKLATDAEREIQDDQIARAKLNLAFANVQLATGIEQKTALQRFESTAAERHAVAMLEIARNYEDEKMRLDAEALYRLQEDTEHKRLIRENDAAKQKESISSLLGAYGDATQGLSTLSPKAGQAVQGLGKIAGIFASSTKDVTKAVPSALSASGALAAGLIEDTALQAGVLAAFEAAAALASFATGDYAGGALHVAAAAAYGVVAGVSAGSGSGAKSGAGAGKGARTSSGAGAGGGNASAGSTFEPVNVEGGGNTTINVNGFVGSEYDLSRSITQTLDKLSGSGFAGAVI